MIFCMHGFYYGFGMVVALAVGEGNWAKIWKICSGRERSQGKCLFTVMELRKYRNRVWRGNYKFYFE